MVGFYHAVGARAHRLRVWHGRVYQRCRCRLVARPESHRRSRRCSSCVGHGPLALSGSRASNNCYPRVHRHAGVADSGRPGFIDCHRRHGGSVHFSGRSFGFTLSYALSDCEDNWNSHMGHFPLVASRSSACAPVSSPAMPSKSSTVFFALAPWFLAAVMWFCLCCKPQLSARDGSPTSSSSRAMEPLKPCPDRSLLSPRILAQSWGLNPMAGPVQCSVSWLFFYRPFF